MAISNPEHWMKVFKEQGPDAPDPQFTVPAAINAEGFVDGRVVTVRVVQLIGVPTPAVGITMLVGNLEVEPVERPEQNIWDYVAPGTEELEVEWAVIGTNGIGDPATASGNLTIPFLDLSYPPVVATSFAQGSYTEGDVITSADLVATIVDQGDPAIALENITLSLRVNGVEEALPYTVVAGAALQVLGEWNHSTGNSSVLSNVIVASAVPPVLIAPTIDIVGSLTNRTFIVSVTGFTGSPDPNISIVMLDNLVEVIPEAIGLNVWAYTAPSRGIVTNLAATVTADNGVDPQASETVSVEIAANLVAPTVIVELAEGSYLPGTTIEENDLEVTISVAGVPALEIGSVTRQLIVNGSPVVLPYTVVEGVSMVARATWTHPTTVGVQTENSDTFVARNISIGSGDIVSGDALTIVITPDPAPLVPTFQWRDDGVNISGITTNPFTPEIGSNGIADASLISAVVTLDGVEYVVNSRRIVYAIGTAASIATQSYQQGENPGNESVVPSGANLVFSNYEASGLPAGRTINPETGVISGTVTGTGEGTASAGPEDQYGRRLNYLVTWAWTAEAAPIAPMVVGAVSFTGRVMTLSVLELTGSPEPTFADVTPSLTVNTNPVSMTLVEPGEWVYTFASDNEFIAWSVGLLVDTGVAPNGTWVSSGTLAPDIVTPPLILERDTANTLRASGTGPVQVTIASPAPYIEGPLSIDLSEETGDNLIEFEGAEIGPICLIKPKIVRTTGEADEIGAVYTYIPGIWAFDEADIDTDTVTWDVYRDGVALNLTNPATYEATAAGVHEFRETFTGAGATRTARSNLIGVGGVIVPVWEITVGDETATIVSFPPAPTTPAWSIEVGDGTASINSFPGGS